MKRAFAAACLAVCGTAVAAEPFDQMFPGHPGYDDPEVMSVLTDFNYRQGTIVLPGGQAELQVPDGYYYLNIDDARTVLTFLWGNPEGETLGMIFPADYTPWDLEGWGAVMTFDAIGYVSDDDAESYDYDALLRDMQAEARIDSRENVQNGYSSVELLGWAEPPTYDRAERKLHWAKEYQFGDMEGTTLNYDLRALGREGVMSLTFVAGGHQLNEVKSALPEVAAMVDFVGGKRYVDFDPSIDQVAAVGIAGLVAGKTLSSKTGWVAAGLVLLKKFWFVLLLPFFWLQKLFRRS